MSTQVSVPLHAEPSLHSASFMHTRGGQPITGSQVKPAWQKVSSTAFMQVASTQVSTVQPTPSSQSAGELQPVSPPSGIPPSIMTPAHRPAVQSCPSSQRTPTHASSITTRTTRSSPETNISRTTRRATKSPSWSATTVIVTPCDSTEPGRSETLCGQAESTS